MPRSQSASQDQSLAIASAVVIIALARAGDIECQQWLDAPENQRYRAAFNAVGNELTKYQARLVEQAKEETS